MALTIAVLFCVFGTLWVLISDAVLYRVIASPTLTARLETVKGWIFVTGSAVAIYLLTLRGGLRLTRTKRTLCAILDSIGDGVLLLGEDRRIAHANPAAVRMLGIDRADSLIGMGAQEFSRRFHLSYMDGGLVPPSDFASQRAFEGGPPLHYRARLYPAPGHELIISVTAAAVRAADDPYPSRVVSIMHDVSEADRLERIRDRVFATAAHKLKTPVAIIAAHIELLNQGLETDQPKALAAVERQCSRIDLIVQNLLVLARIRTHSFELYPNVDDLGEVFNRVVSDARAINATPPLDVDVTASPHVRLDSERFALALRNLIEEARSASATDREVHVVLCRDGRDAEIRISAHRSRPARAPGPAHPYYDERSVNEAVTETIVKAHGGRMSHQVDGLDQTVTVRLPTVEASRHD